MSTVPQFPTHFSNTVSPPDRSVSLNAVKGNYFPGQTIDADHPYQTIWLETAAQKGGMDRACVHLSKVCAEVYDAEYRIEKALHFL